jgi:hypothetical protein
METNSRKYYTLGEFRELTKDLPDDTQIVRYVSNEAGMGFHRCFVEVSKVSSMCMRHLTDLHPVVRPEDKLPRLLVVEFL